MTLEYAEQALAKIKHAVMEAEDSLQGVAALPRCVKIRVWDGNPLRETLTTGYELISSGSAAVLREMVETPVGQVGPIKDCGLSAWWAEAAGLIEAGRKALYSPHPILTAWDGTPSSVGFRDAVAMNASSAEALKETTDATWKDLGVPTQPKDNHLGVWAWKVLECVAERKGLQVTVEALQEGKRKLQEKLDLADETNSSLNQTIDAQRQEIARLRLENTALKQVGGDLSEHAKSIQVRLGLDSGGPWSCLDRIIRMLNPNLRLGTAVPFKGSVLYAAETVLAGTLQSREALGALTDAQDRYSK